MLPYPTFVLDVTSLFIRRGRVPSRPLVSYPQACLLRSTTIHLLARPKSIHADTNYDTPLLRYYLRRKHVRANIPSRARRRRRGRPRLFGREALRKIRYTVERFFSRIKSFRRIDSRYDRRACSFVGFIHITCSLILMRNVSSQAQAKKVN